MERWLGRHRMLSHGAWAKFERRGAIRVEVLSGLLPGELYSSDRGEPFAAVSVDVSPNGFSIETEYILETGMGVILQLPPPYGPVKLKVAWSDWADLDHSMLRCGLVQVGSEYDLEVIFRAYGCLDAKLADA